MWHGDTPPSVRVLLVAPDPVLQQKVQVLLDAHGFLVVACASAQESRRMLTTERFAAVLVDGRRTPDAPRALIEAGRAGPSGEAPLPVLAILDRRRPETVAQALASGARDIVSHDFLDPLLVHRLRLLVAAPAALPAPPAAREAPPAAPPAAPVFIGQSPPIREILRQVETIARSPMPVTIGGEPGAGKELLARIIHARSPRSHRPFVVASCASAPDAQLEAELFGRGGGSDRAGGGDGGLVADAEGGTLFLDEIGGLGPGVQARLLRLIQTREHRTTAGPQAGADVRVIAGTRHDISSLRGAPRLREDLWYQLATLSLRLPPLRERPTDIPLLVEHCIGRFNRLHARRFRGLTSQGLRRLEQHDWPGNVRELESVIHRSLVLAGSAEIVAADDLQLTAGSATGPLDLARPFSELRAEAIDRFERAYLEALLERTRGNLSRASREARHERKSLWRLLRKHGLDAAQFQRD